MPSVDAVPAKQPDKQPLSFERSPARHEPNQPDQLAGVPPTRAQLDPPHQLVVRDPPLLQCPVEVVGRPALGQEDETVKDCPGLAGERRALDHHYVVVRHILPKNVRGRNTWMSCPRDYDASLRRGRLHAEEPSGR